MRKSLLLAMTLVFLEIPLLALVLSQERTWGGLDIDEGAGVAADGDDNVFVAGTTRSFGFGGGDAFLLKYDPTGALLWQRTYGTVGAEFGAGVAVDAQGSAYITGQFGEGNVFLVKFDPDGLRLWQRTWGDNGQGTRAVALDAGGNAYVTGITFTYDVGGDQGQGDAFLVKFSPAGSLLWQRTWGGEFRDIAEDVAIGSDGGVYITGDTNSFGGNDAFLVKFAANGDVLWERTWRIFGNDGVTAGEAVAFGVGTAPAPDTSVYITGNSFGAGFLDNIILVKFDAGGNVLWQKVGGPGFGAGHDVAVAPDGIVYVTGNVVLETRTTFGGNAFVMAFQPNGRARSAARWGGAEDEFASGESIALAPDGSIVIAGFAGAPPYALTRAAKGAKTPNALLVIPEGTITIPPGPVGTPIVVPGIPMGSETFGGATDAVMLRIRP